MELRKMISLGVALVTLLVMVGSAQAAAFTVSAGQSIQDAIDSASPGDTIEVESGTYYENLVVDKQLTLRGADTGGGKPVVDAGGISDGIVLQADGVTVEGFAVTNATVYPGNHGIRVDSDNNILKNNEIYGNEVGIYTLNSLNTIISDNVAYQNEYAFFIHQSSQNVIERNTVIQDKGDSHSSGISIEGYSRNNIIRDNLVENCYKGISLSYTTQWNTYLGNSIINNTVNSCYYGIVLSSAIGNVIDSNTVTQCTGIDETWGTGIDIRGYQNTVTNNLIENCDVGLHIYDTADSVYRNNQMNGNKFNFNADTQDSDIDTSNLVDGKPIYYLVGVSGIILDSASNAGVVYCVDCSDVIIRDLTLSNNYEAVYAFNTNSLTIENCVLRDGHDGVVGHTLDSFSILNNEICDNKYGITIKSSQNGNIAENSIYRNGYGVQLYSTTGSVIQQNSVTNSGRTAISLSQGSNGNTIMNNLASTSWYGLNIYDSFDNVIYLNNFMDNSYWNVRYYNDQSNIWNSTTSLYYEYNGVVFQNYLGNYWSDYTGGDADGDGIGETPYLIYDISTVLKDEDPYPLVDQFQDYVLVEAPNPPVAAFDADATAGIAPLTVQFTDCSTGAPTAWAWDFGDGVTSDNQNPQHIYSDAGTYDVSLTVTNSGGSDSTTQMAYIIVTSPNSPPIADAGDSYAAPEGTAVTLDASGSSDPDGDDLQFRWDVDSDGAWETSWSANPQYSFTWEDDFSGMATVEVSDGELSATATADVTVSNEPPSIGAIAAPIDPVQVDTVVSASADWTDPGTLDTHAASWDWGDGTSSDGVVAGTEGSGTIAGTHTYTVAGVYMVTLTVTDDDGGAGVSVYQYVVVYDPDGGFVTGGGWIESPAGAYPANPDLTGKATFGFVSKYKKGSSVPTGQTEFQFQVADLNFHSDEYDWLVVAGAKAQYKGTGTINGEGTYKFMLSAVDADINQNDDFAVDRFRIKIWEEDELENEIIIYDNGLGADLEDDNALTEIGRGSIVIHTK